MLTTAQRSSGTESTNAFAPRTARTDRSCIAASACHASSLRSRSTMFFDPSSTSISSANTSSNVAPLGREEPEPIAHAAHERGAVPVAAVHVEVFTTGSAPEACTGESS